MKMHLRLKNLIRCVIFSVLVASCAEDPLQDNAGMTEIRLGSGIELQSKSSFTQADTQIPAGEQVFVWIDRNVAELPALYGQVMTADGSGNLNGGTKMFFPMNGDNVNIYSLHTNADVPADIYPSVSFLHEVKAEQKTIDDYVYSDLLYSKRADVEKTTDQISLVYFHQLSKIEVAVVVKDGLSEDDIAAIRIGGVKRFANVSPDKSSQPNYLSVEPAGEVSTITIGQDISKDFTESNAVYNDAIVVPQTLETGTEFVNVLLQDGKTVTYRLTSPITFESGRKYTLHMTISFSEINITTSISDWIGGDDPIVAVSDTVRFAVNYTDNTREETITVDTDTIRFNGAGKTVHSIELLDYDTTYLIGRYDITSIVLNFDDEGNLGFRPAVEGYIPIGSYAEMQHINTLSEKDGRYLQEDDIDLMNEPWTSIDGFLGEFDGNGFKFTNILIDLNNTVGLGLFARVSSAILSNIHIASGIVEGNCQTAGAICGGASKNSLIQFCTNEASVSNIGRITGGIVGQLGSGSIIQNCKNIGSVFGGDYYVGGIAGFSESGVSINLSENKGDIVLQSVQTTTSTAEVFIGGIIGYFSSGTIENSNNTGKISVTSPRSPVNCGGIAGTASGGSITACFNKGVLTATGVTNVQCGGIVGNSKSSINACYNTGTINPTCGSNSYSYVGGVSGYQQGASITACYNSGYMKANSTRARYGGVVGYDVGSSSSSSIITSCYWKEDCGATVAIHDENENSTVTDVFSFADTFTPDAEAHPEWGIGEGEIFGWWKNYTGNNGLPQLWWEE